MHKVHMKSRGQPVDLVLFFYLYVGSEDLTLVVKLT